MPAPTASSQRTVEIDGSELVADIDGLLESVLVVDRLAMPDMFALVFRDPDRDTLGGRASRSVPRSPSPRRRSAATRRRC